MEKLKELFGEELFNQVKEKLGDKLLFLHEANQKVIVDDGTSIPKYRLDEVIGARDNAQKQIEQYEKEIKELKKNSVGNEELQKQIQTLQDGMKEMKSESEKEQARLKKSLAVKEMLLNNGVEDEQARDLLSKQFDVDKIETDENGKVKHADELLKPIKENKAFTSLFGKVVLEGNEHQNGTDPELGEYAKNNPFSKKTLNLSEQIKLIKDPTKKDLVEKLKKLA